MQMNFHDRFVRVVSAIILFCFLSVQMIPQFDPYFPGMGGVLFFEETRTVRYGWPVTLYEYQQMRITHEEVVYFPTDETVDVEAVREIFKINGVAHNGTPPIESRQIAPTEVLNQRGTFFPSFNL